MRMGRNQWFSDRFHWFIFSFGFGFNVKYVYLFCKFCGDFVDVYSLPKLLGNPVVTFVSFRTSHHPVTSPLTVIIF